MVSKFQFVLISLFFISLPAISQNKTTPKIAVSYLSDDTPGACGCFAWEGAKPRAKGKLIYQELEAAGKKYLNMSIDGKLMNLKKQIKNSSMTDKYYSLKKGEKITDELNADDVKITATWTAVKVVSPPDEESARQVDYKTAFTIRKGTLSTEVKATGYCGC